MLLYDLALVVLTFIYLSRFSVFQDYKISKLRTSLVIQRMLAHSVANWLMLRYSWCIILPSSSCKSNSDNSGKQKKNMGTQNIETLQCCYVPFLHLLFIKIWMEIHYQCIQRTQHIFSPIMLHCEQQIHVWIVPKETLLNIYVFVHHLNNHDMLLSAAMRPILDTDFISTA